MSATSFQRGWMRGLVRGLVFPGTDAARQQLAGDLQQSGFVLQQVRAAFAGEVPDDHAIDWSADELRIERDEIFRLIEEADYFHYRTRRTVERTHAEDREDDERIALERLPANLREGLERYLDHHIKTGDFLRAVLSNDLKEAYARADTSSKASLADVVFYLYNYAPVGAWGSPRDVERWLTPDLPQLHDITLGDEIAIASQGEVQCPVCVNHHPARRVRADPGVVQLRGERLKVGHDVYFVYCNRVRLVVIGVDGRQVVRP